MSKRLKVENTAAPATVIWASKKRGTYVKATSGSIGGVRVTSSQKRTAARVTK